MRFGTLRMTVAAALIASLLAGSSFAVNKNAKIACGGKTDPNSNQSFTATAFGVLQGRFKTDGQHRIEEFTVLNFPIVHFVKTEIYPDMISSQRPSKQNIDDIPLFCFYSEMYIDKNATESGGSPTIKARRVKWVDTLLFCGYENEVWGNGQYFMEILRLPLTATVFQTQNIKGKQETRVVDLLVAKGFDARQFGTSHAWSVIELLSTSVVKQSKDSDGESFTILGTTCASGFIHDQTRMPALSLFHHQQNASSGYTELVHMPILGALCGWWDNNGEKGFSLLPTVFNPDAYKFKWHNPSTQCKP